ncbi:MAG: hypothetical protein J7518_14565 [Nocardioidaceae bacterium]|nr:hypothetical protein [Nocardioidaceae bacterium]
MNDVATPRLNRLCLVVAALLVVSGLVHLGVFVADDRPWGGPLSWRKPFTFGLSFGITLASVLWVTSYLRMPARTRAWLLGIFAVDCVVEVAGITVQAWRDQPSHLNTSTPLNTAIAMTLAVGGAVLIVVLGAFAVTALRGRVAADPSMVLALQAGFGLLLLGLLSGAAMIARGTIGKRTGGAEHGYQVAGFVKDFHGVTLHAVLVLPALAWLLSRLDLGEQARLRWVRIGVASYGVAAIVVLVLDLLIR